MVRKAAFARRSLYASLCRLIDGYPGDNAMVRVKSIPEGVQAGPIRACLDCCITNRRDNRRAADKALVGH